jgi:hypothetical protein
VAVIHKGVEALLSNAFCDSYFTVSFHSCSPVLPKYITMSQIFEFDLVTAFNASSLNISEKNFKAVNPNEFYLVSLVSFHGPNVLGRYCANKYREEIWPG